MAATLVHHSCRQREERGESVGVGLTGSIIYDSGTFLFDILTGSIIYFIV